jgi:Fic family protein
MIYAVPTLDEPDLAVLDLIESQRERLKIYTQSAPQRWFGSLRRTTMARAIQGSNSIEGYSASLDEAIAAVEDDPSTLDERTETWLAIRGYRNALTYICQAAQDPTFEFSKQFLKSLHFMMLGHDMSKYPGQWRPGSIFVINQDTHETVYEGQDVELVDGLIQELVLYLKSIAKEPSIIKAAMVHLNLTMIHPFKDGNGRMARALQTLVIALDGMLHPVFSSIEEWLGRSVNTEEYYKVLAVTGQGKWNPQHDAQEWIRFNLKAHYQQAATLIRRNEEYSRIFEGVMELIGNHRLDERSALPLFDAALGLRLTNSRYRGDAQVSELVASRDLKKLCDLGLLTPIGERRGRFYRAAEPLTQIRQASRSPRRVDDPYELASKRQKTDDQEEARLPGF